MAYRGGQIDTAGARGKAWTASVSAEELRERWRDDVARVLVHLGVLDASLPCERLAQIVGEPDVRGSVRVDNDDLVQAITDGGLEEQTQRLQAAARAAASAAAAERTANARANGLALSLSFHDQHSSLHRALGISSASWAIRRQRSLSLSVGDRFLRDASPEEIAARARACGIDPAPFASRSLPAAVAELQQVRATWAGNRVVRDVLIRHLYPTPYNQPALIAFTGLKQAGLWQILNPPATRSPRS